MTHRHERPSAAHQTDRFFMQDAGKVNTRADASPASDHTATTLASPDTTRRSGADFSDVEASGSPWSRRHDLIMGGDTSAGLDGWRDSGGLSDRMHHKYERRPAFWEHPEPAEARESFDSAGKFWGVHEEIAEEGGFRRGELGVPRKPEQLRRAADADPCSRGAAFPRGFSFSMDDLPTTAASQWASRPRQQQQHEQQQQQHQQRMPPSLLRGPPTSSGPRGYPDKFGWNPVRHIERHWSEASGLGDLRAPTSTHRALEASELRAQALRRQIADLEKTSAHSPGEGHGRIVVRSALDGGSRLGLAIQDLQVREVGDPRALADGWCVGDRITAVGGARVSTMAEFRRALGTAMALHRSSGQPLYIDIFRNRTPPMASGTYGGRVSAPPHSGTTAWSQMLAL